MDGLPEGRRLEPIDRDSGLLASVIVPVRNPGPDLPRLLDALARQDIPSHRFEVIVADDGSTDGVAEAVAFRRGWVQVSAAAPMNSYAARNRAAGLARGPVLAFCDADCIPESSWLSRGISMLERCDVVAGRVRFLVPTKTTIWTLLDMDGNLDQERATQSGHAVTANLFLRRELFERSGGFDDSLPEHGDYEFVSRCVDGGAYLVFGGDVVVEHPTRDGARPYLRKLWIMNRWYAVRESRAGRRPFLTRIRSWVPLAHTIRSRRFVGKSLLLDRARLAEHGIRPRLRDDLVALPLLYVLQPYLACFAQLIGWWQGRRLRSSFPNVRTQNPRRFNAPTFASPSTAVEPARRPTTPGAW